MFVFNL